MTKKTKTAKPQIVEIPQMRIQTMTIGIVGDSPLICHAWSEKAKKQMLDKQMKVAASGKAAKNPEEDYKQSLYPHPDGGFGFPAVAFKNAAVDACSHVSGVTKVLARGAFHIVGDLIKIEGKPQPREDLVRIGMGVADIRYRGEFRMWKCQLTIRYNVSVLSPEQIVNLINVAGFGVGVGEWRPQRNGSFGMFHVV